MQEKIYISDAQAGLETIRDPMIALINGRYYLTGTQPPYWEGPNDGVRLWSSDDLRHWEDHGLMIKRSEMPEEMWCRDLFWAPELFDGKDGYFYLTFNCRNVSEKYPHDLASAVARAEKPEGPYTILTKEQSIIDGILENSNDASMFRDGENIYFLCCAPEGIILFRFEPKDYTLHDKKVLIEKGKGDAWDSVGIEGPCMVKRHGLYFLWYSSWTRGYTAGIAVCDTMYGDWKKCPVNPVLTEDKLWYNGGHNNCFTAKNGKDYISYHAQVRDPADGNKERFFIREVVYHPDGTVTIEKDA